MNKSIRPKVFGQRYSVKGIRPNSIQRRQPAWQPRLSLTRASHTQPRWGAPDPPLSPLANARPAPPPAAPRRLPACTPTAPARAPWVVATCTSKGSRDQTKVGRQKPVVGLPKSGRLTKLVWCGRSRARRPRFKPRLVCLLGGVLVPCSRKGFQKLRAAHARWRVQSRCNHAACRHA